MSKKRRSPSGPRSEADDADPAGYSDGGASLPEILARTPARPGGEDEGTPTRNRGERSRNALNRRHKGHGSSVVDAPDLILARERGAAFAQILRRLPSDDRASLLNWVALQVSSVSELHGGGAAARPKVASRRWPQGFPDRPLEIWVKPPGPAPAGEKRETVTAFIQRVYGHLIPLGFTRAHLKQIDPKLAEALRGWERNHPEDAMLEFPAGWTEVDELLDQLLQHYSMDQLRRLGQAIVSRQRRGRESD